MALSKKDIKGIWIMVAVGAALAAIAGAKIANGKAPRPGKDGCMGEPVANTVVVIDHSEPFATQTQNEIVARVMKHVIERSQTNERVTVFTVTELSKQSLAPVFSKCKPTQTGNRAIENIAAVERRYLKDFIEPLKAALSTEAGKAKESPIAQALVDVSLSNYLRAGKNSLLVFSDLLEYTPRFSLYSCSTPARTVEQFRASRQGSQERPRFVNTHVWLNIVPRPVSKDSLKCRDQLWPWFFGDNVGADAAVEIDYLPGA